MTLRAGGVGEARCSETAVCVEAREPERRNVAWRSITAAAREMRRISDLGEWERRSESTILAGEAHQFGSRRGRRCVEAGYGRARTTADDGVRHRRSGRERAHDEARTVE